MKNKITKTTALIIALVIMTIAFIVAAGKYVSAKKEISKYEAILELSCQASGSYRECKTGMDMIRGMSEEEIKNARGLWGY
jgi:hypothetical protein